MATDLVAPPFWIRNSICDQHVQYWKILGRPLRKSDLCSDNENEWALLTTERTRDAREHLQKFSIQYFCTHPVSNDIMFKDRSHYAIYNTGSFAYEGLVHAAVVLVPCSASEQSVIKTLHLENTALQWKTVFPQWLAIQTYQLTPAKANIAIDPSLTLGEGAVYELAGQPLLQQRQRYIVLEVDAKSGSEQLIAFDQTRWRCVIPGADELELDDAKYVPSVKAHYQDQKKVWYVVLKQAQQRADERPYVAWSALYAHKLNLMTIRAFEDVKMQASVPISRASPEITISRASPEIKETKFHVDDNVTHVESHEVDRMLFDQIKQCSNKTDFKGLRKSWKGDRDDKGSNDIFSRRLMSIAVVCDLCMTDENPKKHTLKFLTFEDFQAIVDYPKQIWRLAWSRGSKIGHGSSVSYYGQIHNLVNDALKVLSLDHICHLDSGIIVSTDRLRNRTPTLDGPKQVHVVIDEYVSALKNLRSNCLCVICKRPPLEILTGTSNAALQNCMLRLSVELEHVYGTRLRPIDSNINYKYDALPELSGVVDRITYDGILKKVQDSTFKPQKQSAPKAQVSKKRAQVSTAEGQKATIVHRQKKRIVISSSDDSSDNSSDTRAPAVQTTRQLSTSNNRYDKNDGFCVDDDAPIEFSNTDDAKVDPSVLRAYRPSDDTDMNTDVDYIRFLDLGDRPSVQSHMLYNKHGVDITMLDHATIVENLEFVCTSSGEVIYGKQQSLAIIWCQELDGTYVHAPGKILDIDVMEDDGAKSVTISIQWLKLGNEYIDEYGPFTNKDRNNCLLESTDDFPLDPSYRAQFSHVMRPTCEKLMMPYFATYQEYNTMDKRDPLRRWSSEKHQQAFVSGQDHQMLDMYDLLELYHIQAKWLWRSAAGKHIWQHYVQPHVVFGITPRLDVVENLMNSVSWALVSCVRKVVTCDACGKQEVVNNHVVLDKERTYSFGYVCCGRAQYFFDIANHIRCFRTCATFDAKRLKTFMPYLIDLQATFNAKNKDAI